MDANTAKILLFAVLACLSSLSASLALVYLLLDVVKHASPSVPAGKLAWFLISFLSFWVFLAAAIRFTWRTWSVRQARMLHTLRAEYQRTRAASDLVTDQVREEFGTIQHELRQDRIGIAEGIRSMLTSFNNALLRPPLRRETATQGESRRALWRMLPGVNVLNATLPADVTVGQQPNASSNSLVRAGSRFFNGLRRRPAHNRSLSDTELRLLRRPALANDTTTNGAHFHAPAAPPGPFRAPNLSSDFHAPNSGTDFSAPSMMRSSASERNLNDPFYWENYLPRPGLPPPSESAEETDLERGSAAEDGSADVDGEEMEPYHGT